VFVIQLENLTRSYGSRRGVERVSLSVAEGALFGFLGPNGAGKTTAIRVLLGFLKPNSGRATIFGLDCWQDSKRIKQQVGYLPGDLRLPSWMSGASALGIFGAVRGQNLRTEGERLAREFDLDLRVKVRDMSRGMRQKLGLILTLAPSPRLLVLDEPTSALDPLMQLKLQAVLRELAAAGHTIFFSSHSLGEVEQLCDRVAIVREGRIVADESLSALRARTGHDITIRWQNEAQAQRLAPPAFLDLTQRVGPVWEGRLDGPVQGLIDFLADKPVEDLSIGRPDLESLFRRFYEKGNGP
jgi:ABC-2 type transport system ATP-binding protein